MCLEQNDERESLLLFCFLYWMIWTNMLKLNTRVTGKRMEVSALGIVVK